MQSKAKVSLLVCFFLLTMIPTYGQASGEAANVTGVVASSSSMWIESINNQPVIGETVTLNVYIENQRSIDAIDLEVSFNDGSLQNAIGGGPQLVNIQAGSDKTVQQDFTIYRDGDFEIYVKIKDGSQYDWFRYNFTALGLPDLKVDEILITNTEPIHEGDEVEISIEIHNWGTVDATESSLQIQIDGQTPSILPTPSVLAGQSVWVNTTIDAPGSGTHSITVTPDIADDIIEIQNSGKAQTAQFIVDTRMDVYFIGELSVTEPENSINGPWTVSGLIGRTNGSETQIIPLRLEVDRPSGGIIATNTIEVEFVGAGYGQRTFSINLSSSDIASLATGEHSVRAVLNPNHDPNLIQEDDTNDMAYVKITKHAIPDVYVDAIASPSSPTVESGGQVNWKVTMENMGNIDVFGRLYYTFDGVDGVSQRITLRAGDMPTVYEIIPESGVGLGAHTADFTATWIPESDSYDFDRLNSKATGSVEVESELRLKWDLTTLTITTTDGETPTDSWIEGMEYTYSVQLTSVETGEVNFTCVDTAGEIVGTIHAIVEQRGAKVDVSCTFTATAPRTSVNIIPDDTSVVNALINSYPTVSTSNVDNGDGSSSGMGTMTLFGLGALVLIAVLVAAVVLTREREEEVDRDIFEYCPSCDGELEGDEDRCPHCVFNLKKARAQFHDCAECGESIPDLLDNCAYCGATQDVASFFERRERRERKAPVKEMVALPDDEDDEDEIVTGAEDFADAVKEFGFDEEHLEEEWDTNIIAAEAEVEAAYDRRYADEIAEDEMTVDELEAYKSQVTTTLRSAKETDGDHDIEAILSSKSNIQALAADDGELSASDAAIRERLFEITGEEGVLPGQKVNVGMKLTDSSLAGNEVSEAKADFRFIDEETTKTKDSSVVDELSTPRRAPSRRRTQAATQPEVAEPIAECGACGAALAPDANECGTCGARFE